MLKQLDTMQVTTPAIPALTLSVVSSYVTGPIDQTQITTRSVQLSTGDTCTQLLPLSLPSALLAHSEFQKGYEIAYLECNKDAKTCTVPRLLNELYQNLADLRFRHKYPWTLGFVLGELAYIAEWDKTLALTGVAHVCFLLPFFTQPRPLGWPRGEAYHPHYPHDRAVKAYRKRVRMYRKQDKSFAEAQRLALC